MKKIIFLFIVLGILFYSQLPSHSPSPSPLPPINSSTVKKKEIINSVEVPKASPSLKIPGVLEKNLKIIEQIQIEQKKLHQLRTELFRLKPGLKYNIPSTKDRSEHYRNNAKNGYQSMPEPKKINNPVSQEAQIKINQLEKKIHESGQRIQALRKSLKIPKPVDQ